MNKTDMLTNINTKINKMKMKGRKYSPEILLLLGMAGAVTGTVLACVATTKIDDVKKKKEEELDIMHKELDPENYTFEESDKYDLDVKKQTTAIYLKTGLRYAKLYAPAVIISGASLSCMVASNVILRKRIIGVTAAYAAVSSSFRDYRSRVVERYGEEVDKELRYNIQKKDITTTYVDKKGNEKTKVEKVKVIDPSLYSDFARIYDDGNIGWTKDPQANFTFLKCQQTAATQRLKKQGYLTVNDVYEMLGFPKTKEGQVAGWVYNEKEPIGDNFVDFGIFDVTKESCRNFVNGYERSIVLDFNIDGIILDYI